MQMVRVSTCFNSILNFHAVPVLSPVMTIAPDLIAPTRPDIREIPEEIDDERTGWEGEGWIVIVYDNDHNTWDQVTGILQKATGCTLEEAEIETWEVHNLGKSVVHHGGQSECERAADIIRTIGIRVEVVEE